jgi:hypothetical protein
MRSQDSAHGGMGPKMPGSYRLPRVYFARAIDGQETRAISSLALLVSDELAAAGMELIDPTISEPQSSATTDPCNISHYRAIVDHDLALLKTCDAVLMDMSIADRSYIGCICEMTYAYLWKIPCAVYMGRQDTQRPWLHYHATVFQQRKDAVTYLARKLGSLSLASRPSW